MFAEDSGFWSTVDATAIATLLLAAGTVWLALITKKLVGTAADEAKQTRDALEAARDQAAAARSQSVEAVKSRIDERAPRVIVVLGGSDYPIRAVSESNSADAVHASVGSQQFVLPSDGQTRLVMRTVGFMRNEGITTAVVTMNEVAKFFEGTFGPSGDEPNGPAHRVPPSLGGDRYALGPGEGALFMVEDVRTVEQWALAWNVHRQLAEAPEGSTSLWLEVIVTDTFDDGIADNIILQLQGFPLEPTPHNAAGWTMRHTPTVQLPTWTAHTVHPTRRHYYSSKLQNRHLAEASAEP